MPNRLSGALRKETVTADRPPPPKLLAALEDDLNTPLALAELHEAAGALNRATDPAERRDLRGELSAGARLLGLLEQAPETWFQGAAEEEADEIQALIDARNAARKSKDFAEADRIRDELKGRGVVLEDGPQGTTWRRG